MYYGYDTETIYLRLLKQFAVDRSKIRETALQYDLARFLNGQVDVWPAYAINEPLAAKQAGVEARLLTPDQFGIHYYSDTLIVTERTLRTRRPAVVNFLQASERGWQYAFQNRTEAVDIMLKADPHLSREHQKRMLHVVATYFNKRPLFEMDRAVWGSIQSILLEQGLLKKPVDIDTLASVYCERHGRPK